MQLSSRSSSLTRELTGSMEDKCRNDKFSFLSWERELRGSRLVTMA